MNHWWNAARIENGLRRYARDFFGGRELSLPQSGYAYRNAVPEAERRRAAQSRLYPPLAVVLRHFSSLLDAWLSLGFEILRRAPKTAPAEIAGWRFYRLTVIAYSHSAPGSGRIWRCRCVCGKEVFAAVKNLFRGRVRSCGCYRRTVLARLVGLKNTKRLRGQQFGRLTARRIVGKYRRQSLWECVCECGSLVRVPTASLTRGATRSCGCLRSETTRARVGRYWEDRKTGASSGNSIRDEAG